MKQKPGERAILSEQSESGLKKPPFLYFLFVGTGSAPI